VEGLVRPLALLFLAAGSAAAQVVPNRTTQYLSPTDVTDARALWVNPAGLGRVLEASVHFDLTVGDPGAKGRLRQLTAGFNSRGLSLGYQRDLFDGGVRGHIYRVGVAAGRQGLAAGAAAALYRGSTSTTGWDLGFLYDPVPHLSIGGTIQNIGRPEVRGETLPVTYVPAATVRLLGARVALSGQGRFTSAAGLGYAFAARAGVREGGRLPVRLLARLDTDRSLKRAWFAFGLSVGADDLLGAVVTTPGDVSRVDALSLYGVSTRRMTR
jgi:hypothetical protein